MCLASSDLLLEAEEPELFRRPRLGPELEEMCRETAPSAVASLPSSLIAWALLPAASAGTANSGDTSRSGLTVASKTAVKTTCALNANVSTTVSKDVQSVGASSRRSASRSA